MSASPYLILYSPTGTSHHLPLNGGDAWTIGRGRENNIVLADQWVSREHALLRCTETGKCYLIDRDSRNGTRINDHPVQVPVLLNSGDRITFGKTQVEFQQSSPHSEGTATFDLHYKTVVITPATSVQGQIWQSLLSSQKINARLESSETQLSQFLDQIAAAQQRLPDLLLVDLETQKPNPYEFCRWCRQHYPAIKVFLTSGTCREISEVERRWALHQGAVGLLPAFPFGNLLDQTLVITASFNSVITALDLPPLSPESLLPVLLTLQQASTPEPGLTVAGEGGQP